VTRTLHEPSDKHSRKPRRKIVFLHFFSTEIRTRLLVIPILDEEKLWISCFSTEI